MTLAEAISELEHCAFACDMLHTTPELAQAIRIVLADLAATKRARETNNLDRSEDHTHLEELCLKAGVPTEKVDGDSYGVPGIMELGDLLLERVEELRESMAELVDGRRVILPKTKEHAAAMKRVADWSLSTFQSSASTFEKAAP